MCSGCPNIYVQLVYFFIVYDSTFDFQRWAYLHRQFHISAKIFSIFFNYFKGTILSPFSGFIIASWRIWRSFNTPKSDMTENSTKAWFGFKRTQLKCCLWYHMAGYGIHMDGKNLSSIEAMKKRCLSACWWMTRLDSFLHKKLNCYDLWMQVSPYLLQSSWELKTRYQASARLAL